MKPSHTTALVYLAGCALNDVAPRRERVEAMELDAVLALADRHSLLVIACLAVERAFGGRLPDTAGPRLRRWWDKSQLLACQGLALNDELRLLLDFMEGEGIWHLPLKGAVLQWLYPAPVMRQMSDRDVLFDRMRQGEVRRWFVSRGYKARVYKVWYHDEYSKKPFFDFEMHTSLLGYTPGTGWAEYYDGVRERLLPDGESAHGLRFTDEDFYVYLVMHGCRHHHEGGVGLRFLLDCYVYVKRKGDAMDWQYVRRELATLGIADFEERARRLSLTLFARPGEFSVAALSREDADFLRSLVLAGTFGNMSAMLGNSLAGRGIADKLRYVWRRAFPEARFFKYSYPLFYRHRWLLPVGYVYRIAYRLSVNGKHLMAEARTLRRL